jgi:hypothetical protein
LIGDLSSPGFDPEELDYMFRLPEAFESHATTGGLIGASVAILCLLALGWMYTQGNLARREAVAIAFSAAAGVFIGFAARMLTAGGIGANIGGGLVIMLGISGLVAFVFTSRRDRSQG